MQLVLRSEVVVDVARCAATSTRRAAVGCAARRRSSRRSRARAARRRRTRGSMAVLRALPQRLRASQPCSIGPVGCMPRACSTGAGRCSSCAKTWAPQRRRQGRRLGDRARRLDAAGIVLMVSGRVSFEIAQKALARAHRSSQPSRPRRRSPSSSRRRGASCSSASSATSVPACTPATPAWCPSIPRVDSGTRRTRARRCAARCTRSPSQSRS